MACLCAWIYEFKCEHVSKERVNKFNRVLYFMTLSHTLKMWRKKKNTAGMPLEIIKPKKLTRPNCKVHKAGALITFFCADKFQVPRTTTYNWHSSVIAERMNVYFGFILYCNHVHDSSSLHASILDTMSIHLYIIKDTVLVLSM